MGCTHSSLAGPNDFKDIDATPSQPLTWRTAKPTPDPVESALSAEAYTHTTPTMTRSDRGNPDHALQSAPKGRGNGRETARFGSHAHMGKANPRTPEVDASNSHPGPTEPDGKRDAVVPFPSGGGRSSREEGEPEQMDRARVKAERAEEGQFGKLGRGDDKDEKSLAKGMWKKWTGGGSGRPPLEEYDPVTGIGKRTGMTKDEIIEYVGRTRGGGLYSGRQYAFVSTGDSGMIY